MMKQISLYSFMRDLEEVFSLYNFPVLLIMTLYLAILPMISGQWHFSNHTVTPLFSKRQTLIKALWSPGNSFLSTLCPLPTNRWKFNIFCAPFFHLVNVPFALDVFKLGVFYGMSIQF